MGFCSTVNFDTSVLLQWFFNRFLKEGMYLLCVVYPLIQLSSASGLSLRSQHFTGYCLRSLELDDAIMKCGDVWKHRRFGGRWQAAANRSHFSLTGWTILLHFTEGLLDIDTWTRFQLCNCHEAPTGPNPRVHFAGVPRQIGIGGLTSVWSQDALEMAQDGSKML